MSVLRVSNLPSDTTEEALTTVFAAEGITVLRCDITRSGKDAFVTLNSGQDAETAIHQINGIQLGGQTLRVAHAPKQQADSPYGAGRYGE
ncbi:RNA-binding protein [Streptomyces similanensis]|uniref:RRM domain-containing protein n=1 Tax=Streptomyces similanensis TaxID=1274988 RepID=A0ABP9KQ78_9ACTN